MKSHLEYTKQLSEIEKQMRTAKDLSSNASFNDNFRALLCQFGISNDFRCKDDQLCVSYSEHIEDFLLALIISIDISKTSKRKSTTPIDGSIFKNRISQSRKMAFIYSRFYSLLAKVLNNTDNNNDFCEKDGCDNDDDLNDDDLNDNVLGECVKFDYNVKFGENCQKLYLLNLRLKKLSIKCNELLKPLCEAMICNMTYYPFAFPVCHYLETDEYKKKLNPNKQRKKENPKNKINPLSQYPIDAETGERYTTGDCDCPPMLLQILADGLRDSFLSLNGPLFVEFLHFCENPTYHNPNVKHPRRGFQFYSSTYKLFLEECSDYDHTLKVFQYFSIESFLKGATLLFFCGSLCKSKFNVFNNKISGMETKDGEKIISRIFQSIDTLDNPFLKYFIIDNILYNSFYKDYYFNEIEYAAGKKDIEKWCNFIDKYCSLMREIEQKIYPHLLVYLNNRRTATNDIDKVLEAYETLFSANIYNFESQKPIDCPRGKRYLPLLKTVLLASRDMNAPIFRNLIRREI